MAVGYAKLFQPVVLGIATGSIYAGFTLPATQILRGGRLRVTNTTTGTITPTLYAVPNGGTAAPGNAFFNEAIGPLKSVDIDIPLLAAGDTVQGKCDTASAATVNAMNGGLFS